MNEENEWDQNLKAELVEGPVERVSQKEVVKVIREIKVGKAAGPLEVSVEMILASGEIRIGVMVELCQGVTHGRGILDDWVLSVVVPIFKGKGNAVSWRYKGSEVATACSEDCRKGAREEIVSFSERNLVLCQAKE